MDAQQFDLVVIGSGPAGQKGAICAAKMRKRVAVIERKGMIGGVCVHTGTVPSKTLREAVLYLSGFQLRTFYGRNYTLKEHTSVQGLAFRVQAVVTRETEVIRAQLKRNEVTTFEGTASFVDPHTVEVVADGSSTLLRGDYVLVACGTRSAHSPDIPFDGKRILDTDQLHALQGLPREAIVVGAGVIGVEYTSILAVLGIKVTLIDQRASFLDFVDRQIVETLRSEEHTSELQSPCKLVCRLLLEKKKNNQT